MATWSLTGQLPSGTYAFNTTDHIWFNGITFGTNVVVNNYQDSTNASDSSDAFQSALHNTKYVDLTHVAIDGGSSQALAAGTVPTNEQCPLLFNFSDPSSVATSGGAFFFYDGTTDTNPMSGVTVQAGEGGHSTAWSSANGHGSALTLANQAASTSHNFYIFVSVSPLNIGAKTGSMKIALTYI